MAFASVAELKGAVGISLGYTDWLEIDQARINMFAEATGDHQWIHTDPQRAEFGPFGTTIAHGYLTLALLPTLIAGRLTVEGAGMNVNYGVNKVRFPAPTPVGARVRGHITVQEVTEQIDGSIQVVAKVIIERNGGDKPICVAETVSRTYF